MREIRPIRFFDNCAFITLTQGLIAVVDAEDAFLVAEYGWYTSASKSVVYAVTNGYLHARRGQIQMHRLIMQAPPHILVDHKDGNGLNNRRSNLRLANRSQNARNKAAHRNNRSGVKGVHWHENSQRWVASITHDGRKHCLGSFREIADASAAYQTAAAELHGEFARVSA